MAYKCSFLDNEVYSASDVNNVFACLTSGGVVFSDTGNVLSDLNEATAATVSSGVAAGSSSCKVVKDGEDFKISPGACFMEDGTLIIFNDAENINVSDGIKNYVYLERNPVLNSIDVVVSATAGGEESIPLAEIAEDGSIFDRRRYAISKVMLGVGNTMRNGHAEFNDCNYETSETVSIDIGSGDFSYIVVWGGSYIDHRGVVTNRVAAGKNLAKLSEDEELFLRMGTYETGPMEFIFAKKNGQYLELRVADTMGSARYTVDFAVI